MYEWVSLWPKDGSRPHGECGKPAFIGTTDEGRKTLNKSKKGGNWFETGSIVLGSF